MHPRLIKLGRGPRGAETREQLTEINGVVLRDHGGLAARPLCPLCALYPVRFEAVKSTHRRLQYEYVSTAKRL
jgi:hypothetical protein